MRERGIEPPHTSLEPLQDCLRITIVNPALLKYSRRSVLQSGTENNLTIGSDAAPQIRPVGSVERNTLAKATCAQDFIRERFRRACISQSAMNSRQAGQQSRCPCIDCNHDMSCRNHTIVNFNCWTVQCDSPDRGMFSNHRAVALRRIGKTKQQGAWLDAAACHRPRDSDRLAVVTPRQRRAAAALLMLDLPTSG